MNQIRTIIISYLEYLGLEVINEAESLQISRDNQTLASLSIQTDDNVNYFELTNDDGRVATMPVCSPFVFDWLIVKLLHPPPFDPLS